MNDQSGRFDVSKVDTVMCHHWVCYISETLQSDRDEFAIADDIRRINHQLNDYPQLYQAVFDQLAELKIITKAQWREYLMRFPPDEKVEL
jgi:hypothetical protein